VKPTLQALWIESPQKIPLSSKTVIVACFPNVADEKYMESTLQNDQEVCANHSLRAKVQIVGIVIRLRNAKGHMLSDKQPLVTSAALLVPKHTQDNMLYHIIFQEKQLRLVLFF